MDKFGIFNLINSFYDFYKKKKGVSSNENEKENDLLSLLSQKLFSTETKNEQKQAPMPKKPLGNALLSAMKAHEQLVKKIKSKNTLS